MPRSRGASFCFSTSWCLRRITSADYLATFRDYPQRQKAASFDLDEVLAKLKEAK
jgi:hypothetical protein